MNTKKIFSLLLCSAALTTGAQAQSGETQALNTYFAFGAIGQQTSAIDGETDHESRRAGLSGALQTSLAVGAGTFVIDLQFEQMDVPNDDESWDDSAPMRAGLASAGYHVPAADGSVFGGFVGVGMTDIKDGDSTGRPSSPAFMGGVQYMSGGAHKFFTTLGAANIVSDYSSSDGPDGQFKGAFIDAGVTGNLGDATVYKANVGFGQSNEGFFDSDIAVKATYATVGLQVMHAVSGNVFLTAGIERSVHTSFENENLFGAKAQDTRVSLGFVIPLGEGVQPSVHALRPLAPSLAPVRAAAWNEVLDGAVLDKLD